MKAVASLQDGVTSYFDGPQNIIPIYQDPRFESIKILIMSSWT